MTCFIAVKALNTDLIDFSRSCTSLLEKIWKIQKKINFSLNRCEVVFKTHIWLFLSLLRSQKGTGSRNKKPLRTSILWLSDLILQFSYYWKAFWTVMGNYSKKDFGRCVDIVFKMHFRACSLVRLLSVYEGHIPPGSIFLQDNPAKNEKLGMRRNLLICRLHTNSRFCMLCCIGLK